jgi:hypothetical protein
VPATAADFTDRESQQVLTAAAVALAFALGREVARDYFADVVGRSRAPK